MICITVTPSSRKLAKADLLNAARHGDIIELCLDHFVKEPDVSDLIKSVDKPIIVSCRRQQDGGHWQGSDDERLLLLRQAIVAGPDYIELDLDIAAKIPRFGNTQRVISFVRTDRPELDIDAVFDEATKQQADVVKFAWPTPTLDDAWPLLRAVSGKRMLPIVGMGLGPAELTFSLLSRKYGSPWIYAALEPAMRAHPGQATVHDLDEIYHWRDIDRSTTFLAIAGFGDRQQITTRIYNAAFQSLEMNVRCLPIEVGEIRTLKKMLDALKVRGMVVSGGLGRRIVPLAEQIDERDRDSQYLDLLIKKSDAWHGYNTLWRTAIASLESALGTPQSGERPLERKNVMVLGTGGMTRAMVYGLLRRKGMVSIAGRPDDEANKIAVEMGCRFVPFHNFYSTLTDAVVLADSSLTCGQKQGDVNPSYFRPEMTAMDVSDPPQENPLFEEARARGCTLVEPARIYREQMAAQFKALTAKDLPDEAMEAGS